MPGEAMSHEGPQRRLSEVQAATLLDAQIQAGEDVLEAIADAIDAQVLQTIADRLSAWLARNERVLARAFGPAEAQAYRLAAPPAMRTRDFAARKANYERRANARMQYLRAARQRVEPAEIASERTGLSADGGRKAPREHDEIGAAANDRQADSAGKSRLRATVSSPWTIAVCAPLIVAALLAGVRAIADIAHRGVLISGMVECESGRDVVGMWIAAASGQGDSGYAHLGSLNPGGGAPIGSKGTYSFFLSGGGNYSAHVGCGGDAEHWDSRNYSPQVSARRIKVLCNDPTRPVAGPTPRGTCRLVSAFP